ncbi:MAG: ParB/RepB/Spo0J family partition protein [Gemmataceae bacterium]|nr:ParB/RepB/Spo0J family partition protein [Gemmataceae bacterium]
MDKKARLGRGLDALISSGNEGYTTTSSSNVVPVDSIETNPNQPRKTFDPDQLASLEESIRTHGVLQPLVVRQVDGKYQLIAGERRLRASRAAGLVSVPVHVVEFNDQEVIEAALVENIHRSDLNPIEKAMGFKEYLDRYQVTHDQLAKRLGMARTTITNLVALLELATEVQESIRVCQITTGHAKVLKGITDKARQIQICKEIIAKGLSVHATELLTRQVSAEPKDTEVNYTADLGEEKADHKTNHVRLLEEELCQKIGMRLEIKVKGKERGQIVLPFDNNDEFEKLCEFFKR